MLEPSLNSVTRENKRINFINYLITNRKCIKKTVAWVRYAEFHAKKKS